MPKPKQYRLGVPVSSVEELATLQVVYHKWWHRPKPTAFLLNMQARMLLRYIAEEVLLRMEPIGDSNEIHTNEVPLLEMSPIREE